MNWYFVKGKKRDPSIYDCTRIPNAVRIEKSFNVYLNRVKSKGIFEHGKNYKFRLVKAVCVEAQYSGFSLDDLERAVSVTADVLQHIITSAADVPMVSEDQEVSECVAVSN